MFNGYKAFIPQALMMAAQTGDYASEMVVKNRNKEIVFVARGYIAIVRI
jgi:hypothetical protein